MSVLMLSIALLACACGGSSSNLPSNLPTKLSDSDFDIFDNGVDFVESPDLLQDRWRDDWDEEARERVRTTDAIAFVRILATGRDDIPGEGVHIRLRAKVQRMLLGKLDEEPMLLITANDNGYHSVDDEEERLLDNQFILFTKRYLPEGENTVRLRFHLSPASEQVVTEISHYVSQRGEKSSGKKTIIIHQN